MKIEQLIKILVQISPYPIRLPTEYRLKEVLGKLEPELKEIKQFIQSPIRAIDVGANRGLYTYYLSKFCDVVESFEPQPDCANNIAQYSEQFAKDKINVHQVALSNTSNYLKLNVPVLKGKFRTTLATGLATNNPIFVEHESITVPCKTLDEYNFKDVNFIKIDVEGHEGKVIEGARKTILRERPILLIEIEKKHYSREEDAKKFFDKIFELDYRGSFFLDNKWHSYFNSDLEWNEVLGIQNKKKKVNMFLFTPN